MKRILVDTNVVLDILLDRQPFAKASGEIWAAIEAVPTRGMLAAHAITTLHYLIRREMGNVEAARIMSGILTVFEVATVNIPVLQTALRLAFADFEDAVTSAAAATANCDYIVTRDPKGFREPAVVCLTPEALMPLLIK